MKNNKSSDETEVTPSKKKLKQARLPFKTISDSSPTSVPAQTRKRKLSASESETTPKLGKICKENDHAEDLVIISDDDSKDGQKTQKQEKSMNPFVKLVDTARKKKLQKTKMGKRKKSRQNKTLSNGSVENESGNDTAEEKVPDDSEMMDVDETNDKEKQTDSNTSTVNTKSNSIDNVMIIDDSSTPSDQFDKDQNEIKHNNKPEINVETNLDIKEPHKNEEIENIKHSKSESANEDTPSHDKSSIKEVAIKEQTNSITESDSSNKSSSESEMDTSSCEDKNDKKSSKTNSNSKTDTPNKSDEKSPKQKVIFTPKRSARNKAKKELNDSIASPTNSKLNESVTSNSTTPKKSRSSSVTSAPGNESLNDSSTAGKKLTPKQLQKKIESAKKREEREKEKQEREKKRQQEKEEKAKQKQEKEEQKQKEREEKEEQKKKEKEEKEKQREVEKKMREEKEEQKRKEKEEKEEQRRKEKEAKEEEKRKKQEAIELEKQEQELKKKKAAELFVNFFVPKQKSEKDQTTVGPISKNNMLSSFTIKTDMRLAPTKRVELDEEQINQLDKSLQEQNKNSQLYLKCLKNGASKPLSSSKTWPLSDKDDDDVMIIEDELPPMDAAGEVLTCDAVPRENLRPKLLSFHENRRPPYWGTWRKKSASIKPRKPFGQDQKQLDYEVDSDEEWEEEQEGESIDGSAAGSDDEQEADEYEVDNEVFVPHGYLSDEEATMDDDDVLSLSPETQKARLKHLEDEFESEMKKPTEKLKPRMYGLLWETTDGGKPEKCVDSLWNYFTKLSMIMSDPKPLLQPSNEPEETEKKKVKKKKAITENGDQKSPKPDKKKKKADDKEGKPPKTDVKKNVLEKKNQPGINIFLTKLKSS